MYTKDGFHKALEQKLGDDAYLLLANGGHKKLTDLLTAASITADGNNTKLSITVGGTTKTSSVTVPYASNADKVDGIHANGLLTAASLGASGNSTTISVTVGGTTKTGSVTVPYASNADKVDGIHANGLLTAASLTADGNNTKLSVTVGGTTKTGSVTVPYASNADKVDGIHANGLLTAASLGASGNSTTISVTVGGTTKTGSVTVPYATNSDTVDGYHEGSFFRYRGSIDVNYVDLTTYTSNATNYQNPSNGVWNVSRSGYSAGLITFTGSGSASGLDIYFHYAKGADFKFRRRIDSNRLSGNWEIFITSENIGSQSVNYASSAGNADTVDGYHASSLWRSDGATWNPGANVTLNAASNSQEWSFDIYRNGKTGCYWHVWDSAYGSMLQVTADDGKVRAPYGFVGSLSGTASNSDTVDGHHANRFAFTYNSANYNGSSGLTMTDLVTGGVSNASHGMIYPATDNPVGSANWVHVWSQQWTIGTTSSWVSQIALGVQQGTGMWYRTTSGNIVGRGWTRVIDSSNIGSQSVNYASSAGSSGSAKYIYSSSYSATNNTVGGHKAGLVNWMNGVGGGIGAHVIVGASIISQWTNDSATYYDSSVYAMIKIGGGYSGSTYGQWLLSGYSTNRVGVIGRNGNNWDSGDIRWIAYTSDIPTNNNQLTNGAGYYSSGSSPYFGHIYLSGYLYMINSSGTYISTIDRSGSNPIFGYGQGQNATHVYYTGGTVSINAGSSWSSTANGIYINGSNNIGMGCNDPGYKLDIRGTMRATGRIYANEWIEFSGGTGLYWPNSYGSHFFPNQYTTYGNLCILGSKGGYNGILFGSDANYMNIMDSGTHKGLFQEGQRWIIYYNKDNQYVGIRDSSTVKAITLNGQTYIGGNTWVNTTAGSEVLNVGGWVGTTGSCGWYSISHGGGIYMEDSNYVRTYNSKAFYVSNTSQHAIYTAGGFASANTDGYVLTTYYNGTWYGDTIRTHGNGNLSISAPGGSLFLAYNRGNLYFCGGTYYIDRSGYVHCNQYYASSDRTKKTNIESIASIVPIRKFNWKENGSLSYGFIAQELVELGHEELVHGTEGNMTVNYDAALSLSMAKLSNYVEKLENTVKELKDENNNLKSKIEDLYKLIVK